MHQAKLEWKDIDLILPNPKNPRKDHSINTEEMQEIITSKGWEEGITCYPQGQYFVILSGHRRWYAAKKMGMREIPVFIVAPPENNAEELDRLGSVQGGQVDWNPYEWAKYTFDMWKKLDHISYLDLAKKLNVSSGIIAARIRVYSYYPRVNIEDKLANGMYSITMLDYIYSWIKKLKKHHTELVNSLSEEFITQQLLKKYENKCFSSKIVSDNIFVTQASSNEVKDFLTDINKKLVDCQIEILKRNQSKNKDLLHNRLEIAATSDEIIKIKCRTEKETIVILAELDHLLKEVNKKIEDL